MYGSLQNYISFGVITVLYGSIVAVDLYRPGLINAGLPEIISRSKYNEVPFIQTFSIIVLDYSRDNIYC